MKNSIFCAIDLKWEEKYRFSIVLISVILIEVVDYSNSENCVCFFGQNSENFV